MDLILDTHIAIWALDDNPRLNNKARTLILDPNNDLYFSAIYIMEVGLRHLKDPKEMKRTGSAFYKECLNSNYYGLPLRLKHVLLIDFLNNDKPKIRLTELYQRKPNRKTCI